MLFGKIKFSYRAVKELRKRIWRPFYLLASFVSVVGACDMSGLEGKIVLLTGASSGIGAEAAQHFARLKGPPFTSG